MDGRLSFYWKHLGPLRVAIVSIAAFIGIVKNLLPPPLGHVVVNVIPAWSSYVWIMVAILALVVFLLEEAHYGELVRAAQSDGKPQPKRPNVLPIFAISALLPAAIISDLVFWRTKIRNQHAVANVATQKQSMTAALASSTPKEQSSTTVKRATPSYKRQEQAVKAREQSTGQPASTLQQPTAVPQQQTCIGSNCIGGSNYGNAIVNNYAPQPRTIPVDTQRGLVACLSAQPGEATVLILTGVADAGAFAKQWIDVFRASGWKVNPAPDILLAGSGQGVQFRVRGVLDGTTPDIDSHTPGGAAAKCLVGTNTGSHGMVSLDANYDTKKVEVIVGFPP